ncbi:hypothetical protein SEA_MOOSEHEAD_32 [Gordonia phage Moosehead]|nr:hypothetical protein SEA_MOOSEHEAD_32 [Gordonia phage Moosehead]
MKYIPAQEPDPRFPPEMQHLAPPRIELADGRVMDVRGMTEEQFATVAADHGYMGRVAAVWDAMQRGAADA